jgi:ankyrin repeat protein
MASLEDAVKQNNHELVEAILGGWAPRDDGYSNSTNGEENSVHTPDDFGDTVLIWATQQGDEEMCGLLLGAGASMLQGAKTDGDTPLHRAVKFHHHHMVKFFMQRSSPAERRELNQLKNMVRHRRQVDFLVLIRKYNNSSCLLRLSKKNMTALHYAGKYGYDEIAELLINRYCSCSIAGYTMRMAMMMMMPTMVMLLVAFL